MATTKRWVLLQVGLLACCAVFCFRADATSSVSGSPAPTSPVSTSPRVSSSPPVWGSVMWKADASRPLASEWAEFSTQGQCGVLTAPGRISPRVSVVDDGTSPSPTGRFYRISIRGTDNCWGSRSELGQGNPVKWTDRLFFNGQAVWMSWAVRLARGFPIFSNAWQAVAQWKQTAAYPGGSGGSPIFELDVFNGRWSINHTSWDPTDQFDRAEGSHREYFARAVTGRWVKFTLHVVFSADPAVGVFELFGDMADGRGWRTLVRFEHTATLKRDVGGTGLPIPDHLRLGIYRDPAAYSANTHVDDAGFTVATTRAAAQASAFGQSPPGHHSS